MDVQRLVIAVALSLLVLFGWGYFFPPPPSPQEQAQQTASAPAGQSQGLEKAPAPAASPAASLGDLRPEQGGEALVQAGQTFRLVTPLYEATINAADGSLAEFRLARYKESIKPGSPDIDLIGPKAAAIAPMRLFLGSQATWKSVHSTDIALRTNESKTLEFVGELSGIQIVRRITYSADSYLLSETVTLRNQSGNRIKGNLGFTLGAGYLSDPDDQYNTTRVAMLGASGFEEITSDTDLAKGVKMDAQVQWGGVQSNYFLLALLARPEEGATSSASFRARYEGGVFVLTLDNSLGELDPGTEKTLRCDYFLGPKEISLLKAMPNHLDRAVDLGWFDFIAKPLLLLLNFLYGYVGNYGWAIIILTIIVKLVLWPLSQKSYKSMEQMKRLQPLMSSIREKYGNDRQKMNQEMMNLYKTYKVNPAGGCLPMFLQIPVFFGLYQALLNAIELRHAPFITHLPFTDIIWLADLSVKDPFYITPLIMGGTMFLQQKMTPAPGDPTQAKIMLFMPVIFTFLFLSFPSGLVVYWLVNNVLSIAQQWWMLRNKS